MVVDDDLAARPQMRFSLENEGVTVVEAESGLEAVEFIQRDRVDLILLDVIMPEVDGFSTCRKICRVPDRR